MESFLSIKKYYTYLEYNAEINNKNHNKRTDTVTYRLTVAFNNLESNRVALK